MSNFKWTLYDIELLEARRQDKALPPYLRRRLYARQVAYMLGITRQAFNTRIRAGYAPDGRDYSGRPYWYVATVLDWDIVPEQARIVLFE